MKFLYVLLFIVLLPISSFSKDKLTAGLFSFLPYAYIENKKVVGILPDIVKNLEKESGLEIDTIVLPYKRMLSYLESGKVDFAIFFLSDYSESFSEKLVPMYKLNTFAIGNKNTKIETINDLDGLDFAIPIGANYNVGLAANKKLNIHYVKNYKKTILMLKKRNIDAIIIPEKMLNYHLEPLGLSLDDFGKPFILSSNTGWLQFSNKSKLQKYKPLLIKAAQKMISDDTVEEIMKKYYKDK